MLPCKGEFYKVESRLRSTAATVLHCVLAVLIITGCKKPPEQTSTDLAAATSATQKELDLEWKVVSEHNHNFWYNFRKADKARKIDMIKSEYCELRSKTPNFDELYPQYDPVLGFALALNAWNETWASSELKACAKNPSDTSKCDACSKNAGCYNCFYTMVKSSSGAREYYSELSGDNGFYWDTSKEGRMNECQWARSFADYFEPASFNGRIQEAGYSDRWKLTQKNKSHQVLRNSGDMSNLVKTGPPGSVVVWGVCGQFIAKGCKGVDGIGHIGLTGLKGLNFGNYSGILPDGPCDRKNLAGLYIPVMKPGAQQVIDCNSVTSTADSPQEKEAQLSK